MKYNKKWASIVEVLVIIVIVTFWIIWMYTIFTSWQKLSNSTQNKLQAISIAREWIEWVTNIRDTNWINFPSNLENCWMTSNYQRSCITNNDTYYKSWSYILYPNDDNRWILNKKWNIGEYSWFDENYRNNFKIYTDSNWFFTQSWSTTETTPIFTREIQLIPENDTPPQKYEVKSIVRWVDSSKKWYHEVELSTILTNWKKN